MGALLYLLSCSEHHRKWLWSAVHLQQTWKKQRFCVSYNTYCIIRLDSVLKTSFQPWVICHFRISFYNAALSSGVHYFESQFCGIETAQFGLFQTEMAAFEPCDPELHERGNSWQIYGTLLKYFQTTAAQGGARDGGLREFFHTPVKNTALPFFIVTDHPPVIPAMTVAFCSARAT